MSTQAHPGSRAPDEIPGLEQIDESVWSLAQPNPGSPRFTFSYLLVDDEGIIVIDPGWAGEEGWLRLADAARSIGRSPEEIRGVLATHAHRDHHGLSRRVRDETGAWIGMHPRERASFEGLEFDAVVAADRTWLASAGVPDSEVEEMLPRADEFADRLALASPTREFVDGDTIPFDGGVLRVVATPGHTAGHLCFLDERRDYVFTGDHVLPRITPHVSQRAGEASTIADYLRSLEKVGGYLAKRGMPAHEYRIDDLPARLEQLAQHRLERDAQVLEILGEGSAPVWEIAPRLHWSRGWEATRDLARRSALAETFAHLQHLRGCGAVRDEAPGTAGVIRWSATEAS